MSTSAPCVVEPAILLETWRRHREQCDTCAAAEHPRSFCRFAWSLFAIQGDAHTRRILPSEPPPKGHFPTTVT